MAHTGNDAGGVPKGGGALSGIGETFTPDLHTGTGKLSVPLPLPPGRPGMTPSLALSYSSGAGNGPFGMGWALAVPQISRRTDRGIPTYHDDQDTFVLSGAEELVPVPLGSATPQNPDKRERQRYRPRTETGFARIVHVTSSDADYWEVRSSDGLTSYYGTAPPPPATSPAAAAAPPAADPAVVSRPGGGIFTWLLSATVDPLGNRIAYGYRTDPAGGPQRYLSDVRYGDYDDPSDPSYLVTVHVGYSDKPPTWPRRDAFSTRAPGFELRTTLRADQVQISTAAAPDAATTVTLSYADELGAPATNAASLLSKITISGHDPAATPPDQSLPPLEFSYSDWAPHGQRFRTLAGALPPAALGNAGVDLTDLFGDALPSLLQLDGGTARYWRNRGDGSFDPPRSLADVPPGAALGRPGVLLSDLNGDGRAELVTTTATRLQSWSLADHASAGSDRAGFAPASRRSGVGPSFALTDPSVRLIDLDRDHRLDLLHSGDPAWQATGDGRGGFTDLAPIRGNLDVPLASFTDPRVLFADMTGDGATDLVEVHNRSVTYWPNEGHGRFGAAVAMHHPPHFDDTAQYPGSGFDPRRLLLGDVVGDGTADLLYIGETSLTVWVNQCGNGFADPIPIHGTPRTDDLTAVRLIDLDGRGVTGVLWSGLGPHQQWAFLDLTGGIKPYLLTGINNHAGARTAITYRTSTDYATSDRNAGRPWSTTLPFPVQVVAETTVHDEFSATTMTSTHSYHDGYWDPTDREFRGFGRVDVRDSLTSAHPAPPPPGTSTPLDPLTATAEVPVSFDPAAAGNLLANWSFDTPTSPAGPTHLSTTAEKPAAGGPCAAAHWQAWTNHPGTVDTELVPSSLPSGRGGSMLHVTTITDGAGVRQPFAGPQPVTSSVWVYLVRGSVLLGTGDGSRTGSDLTCATLKQWTLLEAPNATGPATELVVYADSAAGAEFYLDHAWVRSRDPRDDDPRASAPTRTTTWFHLGPITRPDGGWSELDPSTDTAAGYWAGDPPPVPAVDRTQLPPTLPALAHREAVRSLRGQVLRSELYGEDDDPAAARPYEVHDHAYQPVPVLDARSPDDPTWQRDPTFTTRATVTRDVVWERGQDPMTRLQLHGDYDDYGRAHTELTVGVARGRGLPDPTGAPCLALRSSTDYATRDDAELYMIGRVARVARHEALDDGTTTVLGFAAAALAGHHLGELRGLELTYYDGPAFTGLDLGVLGNHGLAVRGEHLVTTPAVITEACQPGPGRLAAPPPPYLPIDGSVPPPGPWTGYPDAFQHAVTEAPASRGPQLGYVWHPEDQTHTAGYYALTQRLSYDVHTPTPGVVPRGLVTVSRDPWGGDTSTSYDTPYQLFPATVTDPAGLSRGSVYDYRVLKPAELVDENENHTHVTYTPLGLIAGVVRLGKEGGTDGDTLARPGVSYTYDLTAYDDTASQPGSPDTTRRPISVATTRCVEHAGTLTTAENTRRAGAGQPALTADEITALFTGEPAERFVRTVEYSDGFGRPLQTRTQTQTLTLDPDTGLGLPDDPNTPAGTATATAAGPDQPAPVVVSGWTVYDNKGRAVIGFEPYLDTGYDYQQPSPDRLAGLARTRRFYDPRGLLTRVVAADGSETLTVPGVPRTLTTPGDYTPTAWESYTYDPSDNAGRTHPTLTLPALDRWPGGHAWNTPASSLSDALGRTTRATARTIDPDTGAVVELNTTTTYDIDGHPLTVTDPLGRLCAHTVYDLTGQPVRTWLLDAGTTHTWRDATGAPVEQRNDNGGVTLAGFDPAHRPSRGWAADTAGVTATLRHACVYGDDASETGLDRAQGAALNVLGRVVLVLDDAGQVTTGGYDLDGNSRATTRRILDPHQLLAQLPITGGGGAWAGTAYSVDWQPQTGQTLLARAAPLLEATEYTTDTVFDALARLTTQTDPVGVAGTRAVRRYRYTPAGAVTAISVDGVTYLDTVVYDAHGRRQLALAGNGLLTRYRYDPRTFRLLRQHTTKTVAEISHATTTAWTPVAGATAVQDTSLRYDPAGNLITLAERSPGSGLPPHPDALDRRFGYDPLHQLTAATGREADLRPEPPWLDPSVHTGQDLTKTRPYTETYKYDHVGNLLELAHTTPAPGVGYTRSYTLAPTGNRLARLDTSGNKTADYTYDPCGNLNTETASRLFEWDHAHRLVTYRTQAPPDPEPSIYTQYRYDLIGNRVVKLVRRKGSVDLTIYLGGFERILTLPTIGGEPTRHDINYITDATAHLAEIHTGDPLRDDGLTDHPVRYQHSDHLTSITVTTSDTGDTLNSEEYSPYGETTFGSYTRKRYRYTGKERDEESNLYFHGARYFAPWLGRWTSTDPAGPCDKQTLYAYARNSPLTFTDTTGMSADINVSNVSAADISAADFSAGEASVTAAGPNQTEVKFADPEPGSPTASKKVDDQPADPYSWGTVNGQFWSGKQSEWEALQRSRDLAKGLERVDAVRGSLFVNLTYLITSLFTRSQEKQAAAIDLSSAAAPFVSHLAAPVFRSAVNSRPQDLPPIREEMSDLHIPTPEGPAFQSESEAALQLRSAVRAGKSLYRTGSFKGGTRAAEGQYWAFDHPSMPGFASAYGIATLKGNVKDWMISGTLKPGTPFVTRQSPPAGGNPGGAIEAVTPANSVFLKYYHMP